VTSPADSVLDNPGWHSLTGPHARFALGSGGARRYHPEISVFGGLPDDATPEDWEALAALLAPGAPIALSGRELPAGWADEALPAGWAADTGAGLQFTDAAFEARADDGVGLLPLTLADAPEMLELIAIAQPGPFAPRTVELGGYLGVRIDGRLAAMAGRRVNPAGWVEVSAVSTHPDFRGQGLAARIVRGVVAGIHAEGQRAFLHMSPTNDTARRVYERLGFVLRREVPFSFIAPVAAETPVGAETPEAPAASEAPGATDVEEPAA
jgi:ribosomal protein S18 acetylase RimI-like enzyme